MSFSSSIPSRSLRARVGYINYSDEIIDNSISSYRKVKIYENEQKQHNKISKHNSTAAASLSTSSTPLPPIRSPSPSLSATPSSSPHESPEYVDSAADDSDCAARASRTKRGRGRPRLHPVTTAVNQEHPSRTSITPSSSSNISNISSRPTPKREKQRKQEEKQEQKHESPMDLSGDEAEESPEYVDSAADDSDFSTRVSRRKRGRSRPRPHHIITSLTQEQPSRASSRTRKSVIYSEATLDMAMYEITKLYQPDKIKIQQEEKKTKQINTKSNKNEIREVIEIDASDDDNDEDASDDDDDDNSSSSSSSTVAGWDEEQLDQYYPNRGLIIQAILAVRIKPNKDTQKTNDSNLTSSSSTLSSPSTSISTPPVTSAPGSSDPISSSSPPASSISHYHARANFVIPSRHAPVVRQYFVKWKNWSHLDCTWIDECVLEKLGVNIGSTKGMITRFFDKLEEGEIDTSEWECGVYFPETYTQIERIIGRWVKTAKELNAEKANGLFTGPESSVIHPIFGCSSDQFLVKWKDLGYDECTYEYRHVIKDDDAIAKYVKISSFNKQKIKAKQITKESDDQILQKVTQQVMRMQPNNNNELRSYQIEGVTWLCFNWRLSRSSILGDEMGLGKTAQAICFLLYLRTYYNVRGPSLIIVPLSTIQHWKREIEHWSDIYAVVYAGRKENREICRDHEFHSFETQGNPFESEENVRFDVLITTADAILSDMNVLAKIQWEVHITT